MNALEMLTELRSNIAEATASKWTDSVLLRRLNNSQLSIWLLVMQNPGEQLLTSTDLTPSDSVVTLPSDFGAVDYMENTSDGWEIPINTTVRERRDSRPEGSTLYSGDINAYLEGDTIVINQDSYTSQVTLWYHKKVVDLTVAGVDSQASTTTSILPSETHNLIVLDSTVKSLASPSSALKPEYWNNFWRIYKEEKKMVDEWLEEGRKIMSVRVRSVERAW